VACLFAIGDSSTLLVRWVAWKCWGSDLLSFLLVFRLSFLWNCAFSYEFLFFIVEFHDLVVISDGHDWVGLWNNFKSPWLTFVMRWKQVFLSLWALSDFIDASISKTYKDFAIVVVNSLWIRRLNINGLFKIILSSFGTVDNDFIVLATWDKFSLFMN